MTKHEFTVDGPSRVTIDVTPITTPDPTPTPQPQPEPGEQSPARRDGPIGINLSEVRDYVSEQPFNDLMRTVSMWRNAPNRDALGWPTDGGTALLCRDLQGRHHAGYYVLTWDGPGNITVTGDAEIHRTISDNEIVYMVTPSSRGIQLHAKGAVRNVKFIRREAHFDSTEPDFTPQFLSSLDGFGVIRFMNWMRTNNAVDVGIALSRENPWSEATSAGVGLPTILRLCNMTGANPWLNLPIFATDSDVESFARTINLYLRSELEVRVELSNEVWNGLFNQSDYARTQSGSSDWIESMRWYSRRSNEVFEILRRTLGDRVICVLGGWAANTWVSRQLVKDSTANELAVAPYIGSTLGGANNIANTLQMTPQDIIGAMHDEIPEVAAKLERHADIAANARMNFSVYEAGQHLVSHTHTNTRAVDLFIETNRHPDMYRLYMDYLEEIQPGSEVTCMYALTRLPGAPGSWGLLEYPHQPITQAHKMRATRDFMKQVEEL